MTALVGIFCSDGVVIGADSAATSALSNGMRTVEQPVMKIDIIDGKIIIAGTGQVGMGQRFSALTHGLWANRKLMGKDEFGFAKELARSAIADFAETNAKTGQYGALVAFPCKSRSPNGHHLVEFAVTDFQPEFKNSNLWYVSMGGGQMVVDPFLCFIRDIFWQSGPPTLQDGIFAATWLLDYAVAVNSGGVNAPVRIAVLEKTAGDWRARLVSDEELLEHRDSQSAAKDALRNFKARIVTESAARDIPQPPAALP